jgi:hypothetical protein
LPEPQHDWPRYNRVAVQPADYVGPAQIAWFQFTIVAPATPGRYTLAIRPLIEGAQWMEDLGGLPRYENHRRQHHRDHYEDHHDCPDSDDAIQDVVASPHAQKILTIAARRVAINPGVAYRPIRNRHGPVYTILRQKSHWRHMVLQTIAPEVETRGSAGYLTASTAPVASAKRPTSDSEDPCS